MRLNEAVIQRIEQLCQEKTLTIYALAKSGGMNKNTLYQIRSCSDVKLSTILDVCDTLGISFKTFFDSTLFDNVID